MRRRHREDPAILEPDLLDHEEGLAYRPRGRARLGVVFLVILLVVVLVAGGGVLYVRHALDPVAGDHGHTTTVVVTQGESLSAVADDLQARGLIHSATVFSVYARVRGLGTVAPGRYAVDPGMSAGTIIGVLSETPAVPTVTVTFPEGLTAQQMGALVGRSGAGISAAQYMSEVTGGSFSEPFLDHRPAGVSLEGFLFPATYTIPIGATAHDVVQMQLDSFATQAAPLLRQIPASQNDYQVVTVASMVEREARFQDDRGLVASVIDNRLAGGIPLGIDASVSYGLGITGEPSSAQFKQDGPYNTYIRTGLPPTPIANPGVAAITAAARPTPSTYLFYVSDGCGHNHYAVSEAEQERNVAAYVGQPCATP